MNIVGEKLSEIALNERDLDKIDLFGRSAFNRFYYASFLKTKDMLVQCHPDWAKTPHKNIPNLLSNKIVKIIKDAIRNQAKIIKPSERKLISQEANAAICNLAKLLEVAYSVRCVADYEPNTRIQQGKGNNYFELNGHTNDEAKKWSKRTEEYTKTIRRIWNQLGLS